MTIKEQTPKIGFQEQLIEAIVSHDIKFIEDNIERINFGDPSTQLSNWRENSIFLSLISNGFVEGFKKIMSRFMSQREFIPFDDYNFNYIVIQICHYAEKDMFQFIQENTDFDLTVHDKNGLGIVHYLFDSFVDDMGLIQDDKISEFCFYLNDNDVNVFEIYPKNEDLSDGLNRSATRRYFHTIFSYLIILGRFKAAFDILPLIRNNKVISNNSKIKDVICFIHRSLMFQDADRDIKRPKIKYTENYRENFPQIGMNYNKRLFSYFLTNFTSLTLESLKDGSFLFNTSDFKNLTDLDKEVKDVIISLFLDKNRVNDNLYPAFSYIILKHFGTIEFFNFKNQIEELGCSLVKFIEDEKIIYINDIISAFQSQKRPPNAKILNMQIDFIKSINSDLLIKKREDKGGFSYLDFLNFTISDWEDQGFNVEKIEL